MIDRLRLEHRTGYRTEPGGGDARSARSDEEEDRVVSDEERRSDPPRIGRRATGGNLFGALALRTVPLFGAALLLLAPPARADEPRWEKKEFECQRPESGCHISTCCQYGFGVYTREKPDSDLKEVRAVGEIDAPPEKVFAVVTDYEHQKGRLPYVEDQKVFSRSDAEVVFWTVADFPMVSRRDWVLKSKLEKNFEGGKFRASWSPVEHKEAPPPSGGVVRLKVNTGSWTLEPLDGGKRTRATYYLFTDPGGSIPSFIANKANTKALPDLFEAVRKSSEAKP